MENLIDSLTLVHQDVTFSPELTNALGISLDVFIIAFAFFIVVAAISILINTF